jgi:hypothetical protein
MKPTGSSSSTKKANIGKRDSVRDYPAQASGLLRMAFKGSIVSASLDTVVPVLLQKNVKP